MGLSAWHDLRSRWAFPGQFMTIFRGCSSLDVVIACSYCLRVIFIQLSDGIWRLDKTTYIRLKPE
jgi:hypothetical protein